MTKEEKEILEALLHNKTMPIENEMSEVLEKLSAKWNILRVKQYWGNNRPKKSNILPKSE